MPTLNSTDPSTITLYAKYISSDSLLLYTDDQSSEGYDSIDIFYTTKGGKSLPSATVFTLYTRSDSPQTVSGVTTNEEGGNKVNKPWSSSNNGFTYSLKQSFIGTAKHTADFTVSWSGGDEHDPRIIINPTN